MTKGIKIATIGGGSSYTPELIEGFIKRQDELPVRELWLVDVEAGREKLEIVGNLAKRMVKKAGVNMEIHLTLDREEALKDADFVTTQLRVGLLDARVKDERIPNSYGVVGQETNGPGGMFKGLRTIPVILDICKDMERLCPDAWLINFANPAGMVTEAVLRYSNQKKVVGLCNGPIGIERNIAETLGVDVSEIYVEFVGLNHMVFAKTVYHNGKDVTKDVVFKMTEDEAGSSLKNINATGWDKIFLRTLNMIPIDYLRYYWQTKQQLEDQARAYAEHGTRAEVVKKVEAELFELYKQEELAEKPKQLEQRGGAYYSEAACNLINSIYNDKRDIQIVNTRNNGAILDIDPDSAVETNCVITRQGPIPLASGRLPIAINGIIQEIKTFERLTAEAAVTGDYDKALFAMTINPLTPSESVAREILDEMLEAHKEYLPNFFK
ncbi:6-phospho-beta-glucosidase [Listeria swaminathanii]|uniref:6-phospho-beta-glucosidase n=1 Tax=Listeria swaminathanii TaxID=2713501 RepID=A0ABU2IDV1_9LIST|nr:6-phospho-beta-glucosidase [Listeria swaminathanii]ELQ0052843.1 6-phospho-beta-glucosidase [Listeria monocytogenes]ELQ0055977.1 6-phospho-beta-glucosidase [Listeria monocytogenes]MDT0015841.1 6-phospho-beta-glucosidase [Listeria swaminathanii]MDT0021277.1 6-phospho-beta-glucosidase [Listeria swaminathanii]MDT0032241.1 6-phospho-beta-glucosidase [Listeria swaminathanii]